MSWLCSDIDGKIAESSESAVIIVRIYHVRFATFDLFRFIFTTTLDAFLTDFLRFSVCENILCQLLHRRRRRGFYLLISFDCVRDFAS